MYYKEYKEMKVQAINNTNTNFGMALHMNEAKIERKIGKAMAEGARNARPNLEKLAEDCEIYVRPFRSAYRLAYADAYGIKVTKKINSPVRRFFHNIFNGGRNSLVQRYLLDENKCLETLLTKKVEQLKSAL